MVHSDHDRPWQPRFEADRAVGEPQLVDLLLSLVVRRRFASRASTPEAFGVGVYSPADVEVSGMVMPCSRGSGASQPSIASYVPNVG